MADAYPQEFVTCKGFGHNWDAAPLPPGSKKTDTGYGQLYFRCTRCYTEKIYIIWLATGEGRPRYKYPDHYSDQRDTRREWKRMFYRYYRRNY